MANEDPRQWMWGEALDMLARAERMHRQLFQPASTSARRPSWEPPVDILEYDQGLRLLFALPGVAPEDIQVRLEAGALIVTAVRRLSHASGAGMIRRLEIPHGRFVRRIALAGPTRIADSQYHNGCLELHLVPAERKE